MQAHMKVCKKQGSCPHAYNAVLRTSNLQCCIWERGACLINHNKERVQEPSGVRQPYHFSLALVARYLLEAMLGCPAAGHGFPFSLGIYPKVIWLLPPGGFSTRDEGLPRQNRRKNDTVRHRKGLLGSIMMQYVLVQ